MARGGLRERPAGAVPSLSPFFLFSLFLSRFLCAQGQWACVSLCAMLCSMRIRDGINQQLSGRGPVIARPSTTTGSVEHEPDMRALVSEKAPLGLMLWL